MRHRHGVVSHCSRLACFLSLPLSSLRPNVLPMISPVAPRVQQAQAAGVGAVPGGEGASAGVGPTAGGRQGGNALPSRLPLYLFSSLALTVPSRVSFPLFLLAGSPSRRPKPLSKRETSPSISRPR